MIRNKLDTLTETIEALKKDGYTDDFKAEEEAIVALYSKKEFQPDDLTIVQTFRFEGVTNPSDMTDLYVIEATDGTRGTMAMSYGPHQSQNVELIKQIKIERNPDEH